MRAKPNRIFGTQKPECGRESWLNTLSYQTVFAWRDHTPLQSSLVLAQSAYQSTQDISKLIGIPVCRLLTAWYFLKNKNFKTSKALRVREGSCCRERPASRPVPPQVLCSCVCAIHSQSEKCDQITVISPMFDCSFYYRCVLTLITWMHECFVACSTCYGYVACDGTHIAVMHRDKHFRSNLCTCWCVRD